MRIYVTNRITGGGELIASVAGSTGAYDLTLDTGLVVTGYDETAGHFSTAAPQAGDLCLFGPLTGERLIDVANAEVVPAAQVALYWK